MGQTTYGIFYGVEVSDDLYELLSPEEGPGVLDRWEVACRARAEALADRTETALRTAEDSFVPEWTADGEPTVLGFPVAVGASGRPGVPYLTTVRLGAVRSTYAEAYCHARRRWLRFAKWAGTEGIALPPAGAILTETEVG